MNRAKSNAPCMHRQYVTMVVVFSLLDLIWPMEFCMSIKKKFCVIFNRNVLTLPNRIPMTRKEQCVHWLLCTYTFKNRVPQHQQEQKFGWKQLFGKQWNQMTGKRIACVCLCLSVCIVRAFSLWHDLYALSSSSSPCATMKTKKSWMKETEMNHESNEKNKWEINENQHTAQANT